MKKRFSLASTLTLMLLASALTCMILIVTDSTKLRVFDNESDAAGREFAALLQKIDEMFIGEFNIDEVSTAAMRAAVYSLDDRWSYYMTPAEYADYRNSTQNQFAGIGVSVTIDEESGGMLVKGIYRNSPAEKAGILVGEVIVEIDSDNLSGMTLDEMRALLARPLGQTAQLTVIRLGGNVETLTVLYELVFSDPVSYEMLSDKIGYIKIDNFDGGSADSFISAIDRLIELGARAFVFDVRSNGGGRVNEMTKMLDYLLPEGEIFISVDKQGKEDIIWSDAEMVDKPAVVLVNAQSYSAAEFFAAILREYDYASVVGEQTTGKSRSQKTEPLPGGGALHISSGQYITKNRVALFDVGGLVPDYTEYLTDEEYGLYTSGRLDKESDPQLALAISVLD